MKWSALLKDLKDKVGLNPQTGAGLHGPDSQLSREQYNLELEFRRFWEEFRSSSLEKEKEMALNMAVDIFCKLVKEKNNVEQLLTRLVETRIFSFVIGRAFVTDVEKLMIHSQTKTLHVAVVLNFFSVVTKEGISPGSNLLNAVEVLVFGSIDKQHLLDSGLLCCLIRIFNTFVNPEDASEGQIVNDSRENIPNQDAIREDAFKVEGRIVHIMKALSGHPLAALSLIEDDSLELLFQMVASGSRFKQGCVPLHTIQLHRHAMQILGILLANDNGSTAKYIRKYNLIKVLLNTVRDFKAGESDSSYTMGLVDLLLACVELSHRPEAGSICLREDIHNAHGYQFLVQFALALCILQRKQVCTPVDSHSSPEETSGLEDPTPSDSPAGENMENLDSSVANLSPALYRLLDVLVNLAQTGPGEPDGSIRRKGTKTTHGKLSGHNHHPTSSSDKVNGDTSRRGKTKIYDLEAIQMLQDILLKSDDVQLQAEVLNRMFKIFSSHLENYKLCQQLRTVPLFILNMADFPVPLQETIFKILEYAVTVVNYVPEQELLSLCCLLQQQITSNLKHAILAFFVKLLSFDRKYKKVLLEVGVLEVLADELKQHKFILGINVQNKNVENSSSSFKKFMDSKGAILSSTRTPDLNSRKVSIFEDEDTRIVAWDCLGLLLKKSLANQSSFRSAKGYMILMPFLVSDIHRSGVLQIVSSLIIEDTKQVHPEELGALIEILKSGIVTNSLGSQFKLLSDAKCDILGALWCILGANSSAQRVFGEATGFSLLLTILHGFQIDSEFKDNGSSSSTHINVFSFLLSVMTAAVNCNAVNRLRLHSIILSQTFFDLLNECGLLSVEWEEQVIQLLLELALEIIVPPSNAVQPGNPLLNVPQTFLSAASTGSFRPDQERVYNGSAVGVLVRSLLLFSPKVQLEVLIFIQKLALGGPFNLDSLTSIGCVRLLLDMINSFLTSSSPVLIHTLQTVQVLGAYKLSNSELRLLLRFVLKLKLVDSGHFLFPMMENLIQLQETRSEKVSLAPFLEMDMSKMGHASLRVSLGDRTWPPAAGYSFVCWFQYHNLLKNSSTKLEQLPKVDSATNNCQVLQIFSIGSVDDGNAFYAELCLQENGVLTLATSNSSSLSVSDLEMEEGKWHHLAVVHSKPNALAGLFQASVSYVYLNGKLKHSGRLGYSTPPPGKSLQVTIGTPLTRAKVCKLSWRLRCCYLFEEVLSAGCICFMYILGRAYGGIFQDADLLQFVPNQACGGDTMSILDSVDTQLPSVSSAQRLETSQKQEDNRFDGSGVVWDFEKLAILASQISKKKLIFAFDGMSSETFKASGTVSMLNLVDPISAAASPIGGIPRFGRLNGDSYICSCCVIGDSIRVVGGMSIVLSLVEAAETRDMLHMALALLASALHQNPRNLVDMQACRGYHLLAIFLHRRMPLFDMRMLGIFFQIAACEASLLDGPYLHGDGVLSSPVRTSNTTSENFALPKLSDDFSSGCSRIDVDDLLQKDGLTNFSELENMDLSNEIANCIVLSNADMVEHVLLDWTLWVTAPVLVQLAVLGFLERMVSMHWYRNHNLTLLRQINLVQHLLVTLQRGDVDVQVIEKLVVLLGVILEDGFLASELEVVVRFVIMTFDPPELRTRHQVLQETMGKHVIVRNMLLEMLIDLQVTINSAELLEQWHKIVSSKLITYFLDEAVHPTSMRWILTLLGVCLASSPTFALKFRNSGGYQGLSRVLPSFYDSPDIYYILFSLIFGKAVYPRVPEVHIEDFHALISSDGRYGELKFVELLDTVIAMAKYMFDRLSLQAMVAHRNNDLSQSTGMLVEEFVHTEATSDDRADLQAEALKHKTSVRLMGGEAAAPSVAMSVLRFMVDLAKMSPAFSSICRRVEFLESCVDLYFSCVRADYALRVLKGHVIRAPEGMNLSEIDGYQHSEPTSQDLSSEKSCVQDSVYAEHAGGQISVSDPKIALKEDVEAVHSFCAESIEEMETITLDTQSLCDSYEESNFNPPVDVPDSASLTEPSRDSFEKSNSKLGLACSMPASALTSSIKATASKDETNAQLSATPSLQSSVSEMDISKEPKTSLPGLSSVDKFYSINQNVLAEADHLGYGGGPCSAAATATIDFIAVVLADIMSEQTKGCQYLEYILVAAPLYVDGDSVLLFQGLCLSRLMNFFERRLLRDDEENKKKLDKGRWSSNLDALSWVVVDHVYMGAFLQPTEVLRTLEFLMSMLQLANKDGHIEEAGPSGKGLLSMARGNRQLEAYIFALLKNTNRMIMYCFLPSFLTTSDDESSFNICAVLQLIVANKRLVFCQSNHDTDLICCLCVNLILFLRDRRKMFQSLAVDIFKHILLHRQAALQELLVLMSDEEANVDILHGGLDKLLAKGSSEFFEWFHKSESQINSVLEKCASITWEQYIDAAAKFPGSRVGEQEARRKGEMATKLQEIRKLDMRHWAQINERRYALDLVRDAMSTELRVIRQDKYGWVLHAESEWQAHLQQLVHERGIFPICDSSLETEWQLCLIEGPYRMRKKIEPCRLKSDTIQKFLRIGFDLENKNASGGKGGNGFLSSGFSTESLFHPSPLDVNQDVDVDDHENAIFQDAEEYKCNESSSQFDWSDDRESSSNEASLHSASGFGARSSDLSQLIDDANSKPNRGSLVPSSSVKIDELKVTTTSGKSKKEWHDNGEYLIRPYLEPFEIVKFKYNCERVLGLDKHDGLFLIGELCLYVIENFYIDASGCICEKKSEHELSVIDQALGVKKDVSGNSDFQSKSSSEAAKPLVGGRAWAYNGGAWGKENVFVSSTLPHPWRMWKLGSVLELLKRDYQLRPVAIEIFSRDGCNDLLVFHKKEREEVFKNLVSMNLPRNSVLDATILGVSKQETSEGSRLSKLTAKSFSKRWQCGEISNFQYLMHLNTLAGRGYSDLTQYPVFPWVLADYESDTLDLTNPNTFRKLDKPMGCQTEQGEDEFRKRYRSWDDPEIPKFHYGSHYSSAGIVLFYLLRLPPFTAENQKLQGGQFDHADRLFNSVRDTWLSAAGKSNTSDVKELIPEFFYLPEFLENRFNLDLGEKQSGEKVGDVVLPPWAKGSVREFVKKHREALECDYVSDNLHHWIDLIFGYKQRGKAAEEAVNVFYHYTYEGSVDIDSVSDPAMKGSILAQINHFGQTPKQLFLKPHVMHRSDRKVPHPLRHCNNLLPHEVRNSSSSISQIVSFHEKILIAERNSTLEPVTYSKYVAWGFPDRSLKFLSYDQNKLLSTHESLHGGNQIQCVGISHDGQILVTGDDEGVVAVWRINKDSPHGLRHLSLKRALCAHTAKITCLYVSQPYTLIVSGSEDCSVILWDLSSMAFVKQLPTFPASVSAIHVNDLTGEIMTAAGTLFAVWSVNGDCLAVVNTSQLPSDLILSVTVSTFTDWQDMNWSVTGHQSGAIKVWNMVHHTEDDSSGRIRSGAITTSFGGSTKPPEYKLLLRKILKSHKHPVTALHLTSDNKQLLSGDAKGNLLSWTLPSESFKAAKNQE